MSQLLILIALSFRGGVVNGAQGYYKQRRHCNHFLRIRQDDFIVLPKPLIWMQ